MSALTTGTFAREGKRRITRYRKVVLERADGSSTRSSVPDRDVEGKLEVWIDWSSILTQLGEKAMRAKGRKAQALAGAIVVKMVSEDILKIHD